MLEVLFRPDLGSTSEIIQKAVYILWWSLRFNLKKNLTTDILVREFEHNQTY